MEMAAIPSGELHAISEENTSRSRQLKLTFSIHRRSIKLEYNENRECNIRVH
jgi:hypothetical protein